MKKKLGVYVHIPFCIRKCNYCDFLSAPASDKVIEEYVQGLQKEIASFGKLDEFRESNYEAVSVFFGGGTPSILSACQIERILQMIRTTIPSENDLEVTLEANPGTLTREKLNGFFKAGVNRLSLGLQSTDNQMLAVLGRIHTYEEFLDNYKMAREAGFQNINIDLMSGLPGQTLKQWEDSLTKVCRLDPEHISAYSLIIEPETVFYQMYDKHREELPDEETERKMYERTKEILDGYGYQRYEISNYGKDGFSCRHNEGYWKRQDYVGFGTGAASLLMDNRYSQRRELSYFLKHPDWKENIQEKETLTETAKMEETMFLGLRRMEGVSREHFFRQFGKNIDDVYGKVIEKYRKLGLLKEQDGKIALTEAGISVSNIIFSDFLISEY
ncbi:MAG: radical SAM family heme chaperone HemW [Clostridiales bacterium]|nr:radical SAM family heme chaperone HemW [Clostridiales bacterium]